MVGILARMSGYFDFLFIGRSTQRIIKKIEQLEAEKREYDSRIENLTRATLDGDEQWFLKVVRKNPECAMKIIKECDK